MTEVERERSRVVAFIRGWVEYYEREADALRPAGRRDPRWDDWARTVHKRNMARVLAALIENGDHLLERTA